jgi:hypothetical protein
MATSSVATLNHAAADSRIPARVTLTAGWYKIGLGIVEPRAAQRGGDRSVGNTKPHLADLMDGGGDLLKAGSRRVVYAASTAL